MNLGAAEVDVGVALHAGDLAAALVGAVHVLQADHGHPLAPERPLELVPAQLHAPLPVPLPAPRRDGAAAGAGAGAGAAAVGVVAGEVVAGARGGRPLPAPVGGVDVRRGVGEGAVRGLQRGGRVRVRARAVGRLRHGLRVRADERLAAHAVRPASVRSGRG